MFRIAACSVGGAHACLQMAKEHLNVRKQFGQTLSNFQVCNVVFNFLFLILIFKL